MQDNRNERILSSLEDIVRAEAPHFFYEKVRKKIDKRRKGILYKVDFCFTHPVIVVSFIFLLLLLNIILVKSDVNHRSDASDSGISTTNDLEELISGSPGDSEYVYNY